MPKKIFYIFTFCLLFFLTSSILSINCSASIDLRKHFNPSLSPSAPSPPHKEDRKKRIDPFPSMIKERKGKDISLGTDVVDESVSDMKPSEREGIAPSNDVPQNHSFGLSLPQNFSIKHFQTRANSPPNIDHIGEQDFTQQKISVNMPLSKFQTYLTVEIRSLFILERDILGKYFYPFFYYPSYLNPYYPEQLNERPHFLDGFLYPELQIYLRIRSFKSPATTSSIQPNQPPLAQGKMEE